MRKSTFLAEQTVAQGIREIARRKKWHKTISWRGHKKERQGQEREGFLRNQNFILVATENRAWSKFVPGAPKGESRDKETVYKTVFISR